MYSVYQHWDPLQVCMVGRSYPPEFYSWIEDSKTRQIFEQISIETEEDFQQLIKKLNEFNVEILRPEVALEIDHNKTEYVKPPVTPRDHMVMIGNVLYSDVPTYDFGHFYYNIKASNWPECETPDEMHGLPSGIRQTCLYLHQKYITSIDNNGYSKIFQQIIENGNQIKTFINPHITGPMVTRIGKDLYFGTFGSNDDTGLLQTVVDQEFTKTRNHVINTGGHSDATYCPVCPGLIISLYDVPTYANTFPDWEVVYLPYSELNKNCQFNLVKPQTQGRWWIPEINHNQQLVNVIETYMKNWIGNVEETVFDVNMLIVDPKNVIVYNYNKQVFDALEKYNITPHIVPFRHKYFWDGGVHCITNDLYRSGSMQDYFTKDKNHDQC